MISIIIFLIVAAFLIVASVEFALTINGILAYPVRVLTRIKPGITNTSVFPFLTCVSILLIINSPAPLLPDIQTFFETGQWGFAFESDLGAFIERYWQPTSRGLTFFTIAIVVAGVLRIFAATFDYYDKRFPLTEGQSITYLICVNVLRFKDHKRWAFLEIVPFITLAIFHIGFGDPLVGFTVFLSLVALGSQYFFEYLDAKHQHRGRAIMNNPKTIQYELFK